MGEWVGGWMGVIHTPKQVEHEKPGGGGPKFVTLIWVSEFAE